MTYTWGYLKENILSKLNLDEEEANQQGFLSSFPYYANEAMTQICSSIKPADKIFKIKVSRKNEAWLELTKKYGLYMGQDIDDVIKDTDTDEKEAFWLELESLSFIDEPITLPEDFISFSDDVVEFKPVPRPYYGYASSELDFSEAYDDIIQYSGYNQIICKEEGIYKVPYNGRWFFFTKDLDNKIIISAPADVCEAIPSYVVSQCFKIYDEEKSAIFRNEYEIFLARIDDTSFKTQRTIGIRGGW